MRILEVKPSSFHAVLLYDPIAVKAISLDSIKSSTAFKTITAFPDDSGGVIALASERSRKVTIQSNRLEFTDESQQQFSESSLSELWQLLTVLPVLSVKAYGINFILRITPDSDNAGKFLSQTYIQNKAELETRLKQPIFSASVRLFLGTPDNHRDLRLTPVDFTSKEMVLQYHYHRDIAIADIQKVQQILTETFRSGWSECEQWQSILP